MVKIGVVGCGKIADRHLSAYRHFDDVQVAVTDIDSAAAEAMAAAHGVAHINSAEEMVQADFDAIDVCVPTTAHHSTVIAALHNGKHVFCEKPLCLTAEEAEDIRATAERANKTVTVGYLYRFHPAFQFAKEVLDEGIIGTPYLAQLRLGGRGSASVWKHRAGGGGGAGLEMLVHLIDLTFWLFGDFTSTELHAAETMLHERTINGRPEKADVEDYILLSLTRDGMRATCQADFVTPSYMNTVEIVADNGTIFTSILHYMPTIVYCKEPRGIYGPGNNFFTFPQTNLFEIELGQFVESLRSGHISRESVDEAVSILGVIDHLPGGSSVHG